MHKLILKNMGPIKECSINIDNFTIFTGPQASGKSTIAKAVYFFRTVKDDILDLYLKQRLNNVDDSHFSENSNNSNNLSFVNLVIRSLRLKFLQLFGSSRAMNNSMEMRYYYDTETFITITLKTEKYFEYISPNYIYINFSNNINSFLKEKYSNIDEYDDYKGQMKNELSKLFFDNYHIIFVPAGRNMLTLLTSQLNYLFTIMDEEQKRTIDYCTQKYIELILRIRPNFDEGIEGYFLNKLLTGTEKINIQIIKKTITDIKTLLKGKYIFTSGEERLILENDKYIKINFTSSGQQESLWILNIIAYQMINNVKTFLIVEEPEAHLYPNSQKAISELLSLFYNAGNSVLMTTHSPYVLGAINNLLYASKIKNQDIIDDDKVLNKCETYHIENSLVVECMDEENLIQNEVIDDASIDINDTYDKLFEEKENCSNDI